MTSLNKDIYEYAMSDNMVEIDYDDTVCMINRYYIDEDDIKMFFVLLKESLMKMKKKGIQKFVQIVSSEEWDAMLSLNKSWNIENYMNNDVYISCDIDNAPECIAIGLGLDINDESENI